MSRRVSAMLCTHAYRKMGRIGRVIIIHANCAFTRCAQAQLPRVGTDLQMRLAELWCPVRTGIWFLPQANDATIPEIIDALRSAIHVEMV